MDVNLTPDLQAKLTRLAAERVQQRSSVSAGSGRTAGELRRVVLDGVEKGLAAADRGELIEQEDVARLIRSRYSG